MELDYNSTLIESSMGELIQAFLTAHEYSNGMEVSVSDQQIQILHTIIQEEARRRGLLLR